MPLTDDELAYMREVQADNRPTAATLTRRAVGRDASGGQVDGWTDPELVDVRLDGAPDKVPAALAARYDTGALVKVVMDLALDVRSGDRLTVSPVEVYQIVTDGDPDRWATAQVVWALRTVYPRRVL